MSKYVLETSSLTKVYKKVAAVNNLNMVVREGDVYGFIGKNGAGKTTLLRMIMGFATPTAGSIKLFGETDHKKFPELRRQIGAIIEAPAFYPSLSAEENIEMRRLILGIKDKTEVVKILQTVGLANTSNKPAKEFSTGMKQRLGLAIALMHKPRLLLLDEPINGLDPEGIIQIRELLLKLNREDGVTIVISSHILGELAKICNCYGVIKDGQMVEQFTKKQLLQKSCGAIKIVAEDTIKAIKVIETEMKTNNYKLRNGALYLYDFVNEPAFVNKTLINNNVVVKEFAVGGDDLEGYFLRLMEGKNA